MYVPYPGFRILIRFQNIENKENTRLFLLYNQINYGEFEVDAMANKLELIWVASK